MHVTMRDFLKAPVIKAESQSYPQNFTLVRMPTVEKDERTLRNGAAGMLGQIITVGKHEGIVVESYLYEGPVWTTKSADGEITVTPGDWLIGVVWKDVDGANQHAAGEGVVMRKRAR
jgi:hypothetical protein